MPCNYIGGRLGAFKCSCRKKRYCRKSPAANQLQLTPACFNLHDLRREERNHV